MLFAKIHILFSLKQLDRLMIAIVTLLISLRDGSTQVKGHGHSRPLEDKTADVDSDNSVEKVPEDLAGRVCYELEPLVLS